MKYILINILKGARIPAISAAAALAISTAAARATMSISAAGSLLGVSSVPPPGTLGYVFYQVKPVAGGAVVNLSSGALAPGGLATVGTTGDNFYGGDTSYAALTIAGVDYGTGVAYQSPDGGVQTATVATLTFGAGVPTDLQLGVLEDNASSSQNTQASVTVTDSGNNAISASAAIAANNPVADNFYLFDLSNLAAGDAVTVNVTKLSGSSNTVIGGLTLDSTPEPAALGLMAMGSLGILLLPRKRPAANLNP